MEDNITGSRSERKADNKDWNNIITRHAIAWSVLAVVVFGIWWMAGPLLPAKQAVTGNETTSSASMVDASAGQEAQGTIVTAVKGVTTTTVAASPKTANIMSLPSGTNRAQVLVDALNVRETAGKNGKVIDKITRGTVVQVLETDGTWMKIKTVNNTEGYISASPRLIRRAP